MTKKKIYRNKNEILNNKTKEMRNRLDLFLCERENDNFCCYCYYYVCAHMILLQSKYFCFRVNFVHHLNNNNNNNEKWKWIIKKFDWFVTVCMCVFCYVYKERRVMSIMMMMIMR